MDMTEKDLIRNIKEFLKTKGERELFGLALANYKDKENLLNLNNFGFAFRALINESVLPRLGPSKEVSSCSWFKDQNKVSCPECQKVFIDIKCPKCKKDINCAIGPKDRLRYSIYGGLSGNVRQDLSEKYGESEGEFQKVVDVLRKINILLNELVHINVERPKHYRKSNDEKYEVYLRVLSAVVDWIDLIDLTRERLMLELSEDISESLCDRDDYFKEDEADDRKYYLRGKPGVEILGITAEYIAVEVHGYFSQIGDEGEPIGEERKLRFLMSSSVDEPYYFETYEGPEELPIYDEDWGR